MRPLRVFLCHASQDKPSVWKLHRYLKQHGIKPWLDQEDLLPGEDWEVEIPKALFASDVILVCLSKNSVNKEGFVQKEITFALDKAMEKPEGTIFIIPVKLEDCEIPRRLTRYQWVDLSRADGRRRLLMGLNKRVNELGSDVSPVILDDARRITVPKISKPVVKQPEEQIVPVIEELKEEPKKEILAKPFTKLLDPSSLYSNEKSTLGSPVGRVSNPTKPVTLKKRQAKSLTYGFWGIALLALILGGFGLNYLVNNSPVATPTVSSPTDTATSDQPTFTSVPFMPTSQPTKISIPMQILGIGSTKVSEKDGMTLLYVPAGLFTMGSDVKSNEQPIQYVYLDAFWIDQTEVTNELYAKCVDAGNCGLSWNTDHFNNSSYANHPIVYVNWNMANAYCAWAGRRLPTEAEWEKAARGTDGRTYPWGEGLDCEKANKNTCVRDTSPIKSYPNSISPYGAYDMAGNVWEWVSSLYKLYPYDATDGRESLVSSDDRVLRGGSWSYEASRDVRSAFRYWLDPMSSNYFLGFRCALSP